MSDDDTIEPAERGKIIAAEYVLGVLGADERREVERRLAQEPALASEVATYAQGVGPSKAMLPSAAEVATLHTAGLLIHPYTFRGSTSASARRPLNEKESNGATLRQNIISDIQKYVGFGIDGRFTDYPDLWRQADSSRNR